MGRPRDTLPEMKMERLRGLLEWLCETYRVPRVALVRGAHCRRILAAAMKKDDSLPKAERLINRAFERSVKPHHASIIIRCAINSEAARKWRGSVSFAGAHDRRVSETLKAIDVLSPRSLSSGVFDGVQILPAVQLVVDLVADKELAPKTRSHEARRKLSQRIATEVSRYLSQRSLFMAEHRVAPPSWKKAER